MPLSKYSLTTYEGSLEKVRTALSRFSIVTVEKCHEDGLTVALSAETESVEVAWVSLLTDLRGVDSCEPVSCVPESETSLV